MRKAFTLIELLVVIAIIAILAAILFPVFAQAKAAAKKSTSISNNKQITLAAIMYGGDFDDITPVYISWSQQGAPAFVAGQGIQPWTWNVQPYMKNVDIYVDQQASPPQPWPAVWGATIPRALSPVYGLNYSFLSYPTGLPNDPTYNPRSFTAVANPAETVFIGAKWSTAEWAFGATSILWYGTPRGLVVNYGIDAPDCYTVPQWCFSNWGSGDGNAVFILGNNNKEAAGVRTGYNSLRAGNQSVTSFLDGHVQALAPGRLGQGTNWNRTLPAGSLVVNDLTRYMWDIE
ncbi:MAG: prepilin-type N-terminal cleavage/methylation domain-containing protein [Fimbriimonadaceae bacterium]|nr:prepilin-type N-terminal cleavage/methylation domain-containing protein [Fimbriimonadaceae bacterium]